MLSDGGGFPVCPPAPPGGKETAHEVWKYNGALDRWIRTEPLASGRWRHKMAVHGGKLYALGGFDGNQRLTSVEAYDPFHNCWTQVGSFSCVSSVCMKAWRNVFVLSPFFR